MLSKENVPGPGTYTTKDGSVAKRGPAYSIYARYEQKHDEKVPGPGMYDPVIMRSTGITIGSSNRSKLGMGSRGREPGPG